MRTEQCRRKVSDRSVSRDVRFHLGTPHAERKLGTLTRVRDSGIYSEGSSKRCTPHSCEFDFIHFVSINRIEKARWDWIRIRNRRQFTLGGNRNFGRHSRRNWRCCRVCSWCLVWSSVVVHMFRIKMAKLVDTNSVRCTAFALGTEFPRFTLSINTWDRHISRFDILPRH